MKISFVKKMVFPALIGSVVFSACNKSPYPGYDKSEAGLYYQFFKKDDKGTKANVGDVVTLRMIYKNSKDSILFDSKLMSRDKSGTIEFPLSPATFKGSFEDALMMMSAGDSASFIINADSIYLKTFKAPQLPKYVEKGSNLTFCAKLEKIKPKEQAMKEQQKQMEEQKAVAEMRKTEEPKSIAKYLDDNKITSKPTASGLYYIETQKGTGKKVMKGDTVEVKYKGMFLDGTVFDASEKNPNPVKFPIGVGMVIPGWDEGLTLMSVGGKCKLVIPSSLAYGERGAQGIIPPYSPLLFEVEVVSLKEGKKK